MPLIPKRSDNQDNNTNDRPNMSFLVLMLLSSDSSLPQPKEHGFFTGRGSASSSGSQGLFSGNEVTITMIDGL